VSAASRKSKPIEITWQHPVTGASVRIRVDHTRNYLVQGTDHIEINVVDPKRAAIPLTETGFLSHFIDALQLKDAGGVRRFVEGWLVRETQSKAWRKKDLARRQGDLFQWAAANAETGKREAEPKAPSTNPNRRKRRTPTRDHN
jgi:hypothetical protein